MSGATWCTTSSAPPRKRVTMSTLITQITLITRKRVTHTPLPPPPPPPPPLLPLLLLPPPPLRLPPPLPPPLQQPVPLPLPPTLVLTASPAEPVGKGWAPW